MADPISRRPPRWLKYANRLNVGLLRRGIGPHSQQLLTLPGRTTRLPRTTPVAVVALNGERYIVAGYETSDWVRNARKAGWALIGRGTRKERVVLTEMPADQSVPILREFARTVRGGRSFLTVKALATDEEFAAASHHHPVFHLT